MYVCVYIHICVCVCVCIAITWSVTFVPRVAQCLHAAAVVLDSLKVRMYIHR